MKQKTTQYGGDHPALFGRRMAGQTVREVCREHNVHEVTFHRWKRKYGRLKVR